MASRSSGLTLMLALAFAARQPAFAQLATPAPQGPPGGQSRTAAAAAGTPAAPAPGGSAATPTPTADPRRYVVEIVVFRDRVALGSPEDWQAETGMARTVSGGEAPSGTGVGQLIESIPPAQYRLTAIAQSLRDSRSYTPVAHAAWEQTASAWGTHAGFTLQQLGIAVPGLTGEVYLERGQYLHLGMTLDYSIAHPPAGLGAAPGTTFVLNETRRVRYYQRDYYDNPAFGVIALVLPVQGPLPPGR